MTSIIIYTTYEKLKHKLPLKGNRRLAVAYWTVSNLPKKFDNDEEEDRVYFAYDGFVQGYFETDYIKIYSGKQIPEPSIKFHPPSWTELKEKLPCKPFQGFKYFVGSIEDETDGRS